MFESWFKFIGGNVCALLMFRLGYGHTLKLTVPLGLFGGVGSAMCWASCGAFPDERDLNYWLNLVAAVLAAFCLGCLAAPGSLEIK